MRYARAAVQIAPRHVEVMEFPIPARLPQGMGLLRVEATGMCGSDGEQWSGHFDESGLVEYPVIPGHEPTGVIERVPGGAGRDGIRVGDRVAVEPLAGCGTCSACLHGYAFNCTGDRICLGYRPVRVAPALWGGFAEYLMLDSRLPLHRVPSHVGIEDAALFNPLASCLEWNDVAGTRAGDIVLILGAGLRGLGLVIASHSSGAARIVVATRGGSDERVRIARKLGATDFVRSDSNTIAEEVAELTGGRNADRAFDTTPGNTRLIQAGLECMAPGGTFVLIGLKASNVAHIAPDYITLNALTIKGVLGTRHSESYRRAIDIIASGTYPLAELHTHRVGLDSVADTMRMLANHADDVVHATVVP